MQTLQEDKTEILAVSMNKASSGSDPASLTARQVRGGHVDPQRPGWVRDGSSNETTGNMGREKAELVLYLSKDDKSVKS